MKPKPVELTVRQELAQGIINLRGELQGLREQVINGQHVNIYQLDRLIIATRSLTYWESIL